MAFDKGRTESAGEPRRIAEVGVLGRVPDSSGHTTEELLARPLIGKTRVLGLQRDVDDVVGTDRTGPLGHADRTGQTQERSQRQRIE